MRRAGVEILFMCWPWAKMEPVKASILNPTRPPNELHMLPKTFHVSSEHSGSSALPPNLFSSEAAVYAPPMPQHLSAGFLLALALPVEVGPNRLPLSKDVDLPLTGAWCVRRWGGLSKSIFSSSFPRLAFGTNLGRGNFWRFVSKSGDLRTCGELPPAHCSPICRRSIQIYSGTVHYFWHVIEDPPFFCAFNFSHSQSHPINDGAQIFQLVVYLLEMFEHEFSFFPLILKSAGVLSNSLS